MIVFYSCCCMMGAGGCSWMTRTCVSRPARPSFTVLCPLEPASMWWETWTQVSNTTLQPHTVPMGLQQHQHLKHWCFLHVHRYKLRLHPGVSPQHRDVASHQAHVSQRPLQNSLRRPAHRQLSTVPPSAEPGHVPNQSLTPRVHAGAFYLLQVWV